MSGFVEFALGALVFWALVALVIVRPLWPWFFVAWPALVAVSLLCGGLLLFASRYVGDRY